MNRPKRPRVKPDTINAYIVSNLELYISDLEKYCDELEKALDKSIDLLQEAHHVSFYNMVFPYQEHDVWLKELMGNEHI